MSLQWKELKELPLDSRMKVLQHALWAHGVRTWGLAKSTDPVPGFTCQQCDINRKRKVSPQEILDHLESEEHVLARLSK
jgi:hypothetical protein